MNPAPSIQRLARYRELLPVMAGWFKAEWPHWYGPGGQANAENDLRAYANEGGLPVGVVAHRNGQACGVAALKAQSIESHTHLTPWAAAGYVLPALRGQGIGRALLHGLETEAELLGYPHIYCATATAASLLERAGWFQLETIWLEGKNTAIYAKALRVRSSQQ